MGLHTLLCQEYKDFIPMKYEWILQIKKNGLLEMTSVWHPLQIHFPLFFNIFSFLTPLPNHKILIIIGWPIWITPKGSYWVWSMAPMVSPGHRMQGGEGCETGNFLLP